VKSERPAVSVCVPAYNTVRFIEETISSVLDQSYTDLELVVVDDDSSDGTAAAIASIGDERVRLFRNNRNIGAEANWNRAVSLARGRFVKVVCGDDVLAPGCLASQVHILDAHPEVGLVAGQRDVIDENGRVLLTGRGLGALRGVVDGADAVRATVRSGTNLFGEPACVLLRRDLMSCTGSFSGGRPYMIDLDYWCRQLRFGSLFAQDETVAAFRVSLQSWSVDLVQHQSAQAISFFRELHRQNPAGVSKSDLAHGIVKAKVLASARAASYRALAVFKHFEATGCRLSSVPQATVSTDYLPVDHG
jgi:glycosyltransferase involved in cell wall biosynthesis